MTVLPIVERELRVASRRASTAWWRVVSAGAALMVFGLVLLTEWGSSPRSLGQSLFLALSICFLGVSLLVGVVYTADVLSEERREGTLGLLFLTDLHGYDVVLGKLVASSVGAVYGLVAMLPVLAMPLLMGGVTLTEFGRLVLVLVNTLFFSLSAGMLASALVRHGLLAMGLTLAVVVGVNLAGPLLALYVQWEAGAPGVEETLLIPSAGYALATAYERTYGSHRDGFWVSLAFLHGLAWMCLLCASVRTRHAWQEQGVLGSSDGPVWWRRLTRGLPGQVQDLRREMLDLNPCLWLAARHLIKPRLVWLFVGMAGLLWLAGWWRWGREWATEGLSALCLVLVWHTVLRWWLAAEAVQCFGPDHRSGALELLLTTPMTVQDILHGRLLALQRQFLSPSLLIAAVDVGLLSVSARQSGDGDAHWWLWLCAALVAIFVLDMVALAFLGMWLGLTRRQARWALLGSTAWVFGVPWGLFLGFLLVISVLRIRVPEPEMAYVLAAYVVPSLGVSLGVAVWARERLLRDLRRVAASRFDRRQAGAIPQPG